MLRDGFFRLCAALLPHTARLAQRGPRLVQGELSADRLYQLARQLSARPQSLIKLHCLDDTGATLDEFREAVTTYEEIEPTARRVLGGAHPATRWIECSLRHARAELATRETPPGAA